MVDNVARTYPYRRRRVTKERLFLKAEASPLQREVQGVRLRTFMMLTITVVLALVCTTMIILQNVILAPSQHDLMGSYEASSRTQADLIKNLSDQLARWTDNSTLATVSSGIQDCICTPTHRTVNKLWGSLRMLDMWNPTWDTTGGSISLGTRALEVFDEWCQDPGPLSRCLLNFTEVDQKLCTRGSGSLRSLFIIDEDTQDHMVVWVNCSGLFMASGRRGIAEMECTEWAVLNGTGARLRERHKRTHCAPSEQPWYRSQRDVAMSGQLLRGMWSNIDELPGNFYDIANRMTWTVPITTSGSSRFKGVVGASMSLQIVSQMCDLAWQNLWDDLSKVHEYKLYRNYSSVYVLWQHSTRLPENEGLLLGSSGCKAAAGVRSRIHRANESDDWTVNFSAQALLSVHGRWDATELLSRSHLNIREDRESGQGYRVCQRLSGSNERTCMRINTQSIVFDEDLRVLVVVAFPQAAVFQSARKLLEKIADEAGRGGFLNTAKWNDRLCGLITVLVALVCAWSGSKLSGYVTLPLEHLSGRMRSLRALDFSEESGKFEKTVSDGGGSRIAEVAKLQSEFVRLSRGMEVFAQFVPTTVVRSIVEGDGHTGLHVDRREVTILFSDIRGFTSIAEQLAQDDLLEVLTGYLSRMTNVIELNRGVVSEVHGDGILAYWNTPDRLEDHADWACRAALNMHAELGPMNERLREEGKPELHIRVGIHSGEVLTGNLGSERKMKFGCMGDNVNMAGRLEELCKFYSVTTLCSGDTCELLSRDFQLRKLDRIRVKGSSPMLEVCELMGSTKHAPPLASERLRHAEVYERALQAYREARFPEVLRQAEELRRLVPQDEATRLLLEAARAHVGPDGFSVVGLSAEDLSRWQGTLHPADK